MTSSISIDQTDGPKRGKVGTRHLAIQQLALELVRAQNDNGYQFSILMVEFDGLSLVVDHLGDASGHDVLQMVTGVLTKDLGGHDLCCRLGGDEFLLIFPTKGEPECLAFAERLRRAWVPGASTREADIDVSIGFASSHGQGSTIQKLFAAADEAMHTLNQETVVPKRGIAIIPSAGMRGKEPAGLGLLANQLRAVAQA